MKGGTKTILVIEDEAPLREALREKLKHEGFAVLEAKNGKEGLETALAKHPDMILLDIMMPVMDGMTMLKQLRQDAWGKEVCVMMLTNLNDTGKVAEATEQESFHFLVKSDWKIEDIVKKIRECLPA